MVVHVWAWLWNPVNSTADMLLDGQVVALICMNGLNWP
jgi:hypothetical protein